MDKFKTWVAEVAWKKMGPSLIRGAISSLVVYLAAHAEVLATLGIVYNSSLNQITISLNQTSGALLILGGGLVTAIVSGAWHHTTAVVKGAPQSGDMRETPNVPTEGGQRSTDPQSIGEPK